MLIELPSGLKGEARKIRGSEAIELAERAGQPGGNSLGSILRGCWTRTVDPGPYAHAVEGQPGLDWDRVLKGDLLAGLLALRALSIPTKGEPPWIGARYDFYVQCEQCKRRYEWSVGDVVHDLPRRGLPPESVAKFRAGETFKVLATDADGGVHPVTFDLMLPEQDNVLRQLMKQLNRKRATPVESLTAQTRTIDGEAKSPAARQRFFRDLDLGELNRLRDLYDAADCGVDVDILTTCADVDCQWEQETALPFGRTFWRPETRKAPPEEEPVPTGSVPSSGASSPT